MDRDAGFTGIEEDVGGQVVLPAVDVDRVAGLEDIGLQDRADRRLGRTRGQAVVDVVARRPVDAGVQRIAEAGLVVGGTAVVHVIGADGGDDFKGRA